MKDISEEADERDPDTSLSEDLRIFRIQGSGFVNGIRIPTTQRRIITSQDSGDRIHPSQRVSNASCDPLTTKYLQDEVRRVREQLITV